MPECVVLHLLSSSIGLLGSIMAVGKGWRGGKGADAETMDVTLILGVAGTAGATGGKGRRT